MRSGRESAGVRTEGAAEKLGVSVTMVNHWESGRSFPSVEHLQGMVALYNVSADWLLGNTREDENDYEDLLLASYRGLDPKYRRALREVARGLLCSDADSDESAQASSPG